MRGEDRVRFAPSPTGELHLGNARTALYNAAAAARGGAFVLRYDDTDIERSRDAYAVLIAEDLAWLGIVPDEIAKQSERIAQYDEAADRLRGNGLLYPCYETPDELERRRALSRAQGRPPIYDRAALSLSAADRARLEADGRRPHWRFKLPAETVTFSDRCRGEQTVDLASVSDPVLVREDGSYLYTLPSVVDDLAMRITLVVRGEDHVTNTGVQIALFEALGGIAPEFAHHNLLTRADGEPLSKRDNPLSLKALREKEAEPMAVASLAALVGTAEAVEAVPSLPALYDRLAFDRISRAPATFDPADVWRLTAELVHSMPYEAAEPRLATFGAAEPSFWDAVRANVSTVGEAAIWQRARLVRPALSASDFPDGAATVLHAAAQGLPPEPWAEGTYKDWVDMIHQATGAKGKRLFLPLRLALTGASAGPELGPWIRLLGHDETRARLTAAARQLD